MKTAGIEAMITRTRSACTATGSAIDSAPRAPTSASRRKHRASPYISIEPRPSGRQRCGYEDDAPDRPAEFFFSQEA
jgi:hypothetical protein